LRQRPLGSEVSKRPHVLFTLGKRSRHALR
jgi:hypothetical protein